jgi:hypothetical protein
MVTSQKMKETKMGYRGSKSEFHNPQPIEISVKEQRVDGSYFGSESISRLRCTLMGKEICYQTKIPSKQIIRPAFLGSLWLGIAAKNFSTNSQCKNLLPFSSAFYKKAEKSYNLSILPEGFTDKGKSDVNLKKLDPWFVTGFTDAEGCFGLYIYKNVKYKTGWSINLFFQISLHPLLVPLQRQEAKDKKLLEQIQNYFGVGGITSHDSTSLKYSVRSYKDMQIIIDHFDKFPLITNKLNDYKLFKLAYILFLKKEQLSLAFALMAAVQPPRGRYKKISFN